MQFEVLGPLRVVEFGGNRVDLASTARRSFLCSGQGHRSRPIIWASTWISPRVRRVCVSRLRRRRRLRHTRAPH